MYALSGLCKHNSAAVKQLGESGGWEALSTALEGQGPVLFPLHRIDLRGLNRLGHRRSTKGRIPFELVTDSE